MGKWMCLESPGNKGSCGGSWQPKGHTNAQRRPGGGRLALQLAKTGSVVSCSLQTSHCAVMWLRSQAPLLPSESSFLEIRGRRGVLARGWVSPSLLVTLGFPNGQILWKVLNSNLSTTLSFPTAGAWVSVTPGGRTPYSRVASRRLPRSQGQSFPSQLGHHFRDLARLQGDSLNAGSPAVNTKVAVTPDPLPSSQHHYSHSSVRHPWISHDVGRVGGLSSPQECLGQVASISTPFTASSG